MTQSRRFRPEVSTHGAARIRPSDGRGAIPALDDLSGYAPLLAGGVNAASPAGDPRGLVNAAAVLSLQRTHGNAHVGRMLDRARAIPNPPPGIQRAAGVVVQRSIDVAEAKQRIRKASKGVGTDESMIYEAIRLCADRAALKADPEVQHYLKKEMKGHDLWKAQLLLEFGAEAAFPPTVRAIWEATKGAGTDEARIYKAIDKLTPAQLDELLEIPGLRGILKADLNKGEMKRAIGGAGILDRHKQNVAFVKKVLEGMKKPGRPPLVRNTGEWLAPAGGGPGGIDLIVLTKTHDAAARAKKHDKSGKVAYFGAGQTYPDDTADYDLAITSTRNIYFAAPDHAGSQGASGIRLMEPKEDGSASVRSTLIHEVQHDADQSDRDPDWKKGFKSPEQSWVRYRTEFRAYWIDGDRDKFSDVSGTASEARFDNLKQEKIFVHLWGDGEDDSYAKWLRPNYRRNTTVGGQKFRDLVHGYMRPEGINLVNSPRIDRVYRRLRYCDQTDKVLARSPLKELKAAAEALDADDRAYVNSAPAAALQKMMKDNLAAGPLKQIATIVNGGTLPTWAR